MEKLHEIKHYWSIRQLKSIEVLFLHFETVFRTSKKFLYEDFYCKK